MHQAIYEKRPPKAIVGLIPCAGDYIKVGVMDIWTCKHKIGKSYYDYHGILFCSKECLDKYIRRLDESIG
jgi:hypothetical protein